MKLLICTLLLFFCTQGYATDSFVVSGRLLDSSNKPVVGNSIAFTIDILDPTANECVLHSENTTLNMSTSNGMFDLNVGAAASLGPYSLKNSFNNGIVFSGLTCLSGSTYIPSPNDGRKIRITFNDGSPHVLSPIEISSVPSAFSAETIGGFSATSLVRVADSGTAGNVSPLSTSNFNELVAIANGTSAQYAKTGQLNGTAIPAMSSGTVLGWNGSSWNAVMPLTTESDPSVMNFAKTNLPTCAAGEVLKSDGTSFNCVTTSGGAPSGFAGGDLGGSYPNPSIDKIKGTSLSIGTLTSGQFLKYNGAWINASVSTADLADNANILKASNMPANCSSGQTLTFSSPTGSWVCANINGIDGSAISSGTIANARLPVSATAWQPATGGINYAGGKVGIGTTTPDFNLDIQESDMAFGLRIMNTNSTGSKKNPSVNVTNYSGLLPNGEANINLVRARGTFAVPAAVEINDFLGAVIGWGQYSGNNGEFGKGAYIGMYATGNFSNGIYPTNIGFFTTASNNPTEKMTIASTGNVGIGTTSPNSKLTVNGMIEATSGGIKFPNGTVQNTAAASGQIVAFGVSQTFIVPANVVKVKVTVIGGGGGGGGSSSNSVGAGGGGAGSVCKGYVTVSPGATMTVTVGLGGASGNTSAAGGNGGASSFDGITSPGGSGGQSNGAGGAGAAVGSGGSFCIGGQAGSPGIINGSNGIGGMGGSTYEGYGLGGPAVVSSTGAAGTGFGGGGGGGGSSFGSGYIGGIGKAGSVIIEY